MNDYWCCIITKDGASTLGETLDSIVGQSLPPSFIVVVNDGSQDETSSVLQQKSKLFPRLFVINTFSRTRDIRRVPLLLNLGLDYVSKMTTRVPSYMMVSGDDNTLAPNYSAAIITRMNADERLAVASGSWLGAGGRSKSQMPHGGGRFVRMAFMKKIGGSYPVAYGWETWILYKAMQLGFSVKNYGDLRYQHLRAYTPTNLLGWGRAMYSLGFPSYFVLMRFALNFLWASRGTQSRKASISMLAGYLAAKVNSRALQPMLIKDPQLKSFVRAFTSSRLARLQL